MKKKSGREKLNQRALTYTVCGGVFLISVFALLVRPGLHETAASYQASPSPLPVLDASPAATPTAEPTAAPHPVTAVDVYADGTLLFTLESRTAATALFSSYLDSCVPLSLEDGESLVSASFAREITTRTASGDGEYISAEEAMERLKNDPALAPVRLITVKNAFTETLPAPVETDSPALPAGTRLVRSAGKREFTWTRTETTLENGTVTDSASNSFKVGAAASGAVIENGTGEALLPGDEETAPRLHAPVKGTLSSAFGTDENGVFRYGIDYLSETGYAVYAPGDGTVIYCAERGALGTVIEIEHGDSGFVSRLSGLAENTVVSLGDTVSKGQSLGSMPSLEQKKKPVLRYELLYDGIPVDPVPYLKP